MTHLAMLALLNDLMKNDFFLLNYIFMQENEQWAYIKNYLLAVSNTLLLL